MATLQAPVPLQPVSSLVEVPVVVSDGLKRPLEVTSLPPGTVLSLPPSTVSSTSSVGLEPLSKKAKQQHHQSVVSSDDEAGASSGTTIAKKKKPQMKYDPDVPMSKEEATAWRREQRRKRNRESAAASRQRQRDRISELEAEVARYKKAFDAVQAQIKSLEERQKQPATVVSVSRSETPEPVTSILTQPVSPTTSTFLDLNAGDGIVDKPTLLQTEAFSQEQQLQQPIKMISRHAVQNHSPKTFSEARVNLCPAKSSSITAQRRLCLGLS